MTRRSASKTPRLRRSLSSILVFAMLINVALTFAAEKSTSKGAISARMQEIFDFNRNSIVKIQSTDSHGWIEGTGFYADSSGTIYTGLNAVGDGTNITVIQGLRKLPARLEVADPRTGIALIKVDTTTPFLPIGDSSKVDVYTPVVAIGYPFGKSSIWSAGLVIGLDKKYLHRFFHTTHLRTKLPVQPGFGGAPVFNLKGEVIGIVVASNGDNSGCYVLPINAAEKVRTDFNRFHHIKPGWVGIFVEPTENATLPSTARVASLPPGPASQAGLKEGDILLRVGDIVIQSPEDIFDASFFLTAGDETLITVWRNGVEQKFTVRAEKGPSSTQTDHLILSDHSIFNLQTVTAPIGIPNH